MGCVCSEIDSQDKLNEAPLIKTDNSDFETAEKINRNFITHIIILFSGQLFFLK